MRQIEASASIKHYPYVHLAASECLCALREKRCSAIKRASEIHNKRASNAAAVNRNACDNCKWRVRRMRRKRWTEIKLLFKRIYSVLKMCVHFAFLSMYSSVFCCWVHAFRPFSYITWKNFWARKNKLPFTSTSLQIELLSLGWETASDTVCFSPTAKIAFSASFRLLCLEQRLEQRKKKMTKLRVWCVEEDKLRFVDEFGRRKQLDGDGVRMCGIVHLQNKFSVNRMAAAAAPTEVAKSRTIPIQKIVFIRARLCVCVRGRRSINRMCVAHGSRLRSKCITHAMATERDAGCIRGRANEMECKKALHIDPFRFHAIAERALHCKCTFPSLSRLALSLLRLFTERVRLRIGAASVVLLLWRDSVGKHCNRINNETSWRLEVNAGVRVCAWNANQVTANGRSRTSDSFSSLALLWIYISIMSRLLQNNRHGVRLMNSFTNRFFLSLLFV